MNINAINTNFKGHIKIHELDSSVNHTLDANKILDIEAREKNRTIITYDRPKEVRHNGYIYHEPTRFHLDLDINTVLDAYNAAKNSDISVDISQLSR